MSWSMRCNPRPAKPSTEATSARIESRQAGAHKFGPMAASTKANGVKIELMVKVSFGTQTVMSMKATGATTRPMATDCTSMRMEPGTWVSGRTISKTALAWKRGLMAASIKESTVMEKSMDKAFTNGSTALSTKEAGSTTRLAVSEHTSGPMAVYTKANGPRIICMDVDFTLGVMADSMRASTRTTKSTDMELICGLTVAHILEAGKTESSTDRVNIASSMVRCAKASGMKASAPTGSMRWSR